ncbi:hypothetical protein PSPO01_06551 [Paraphaeosphaeria sporulosa]
MAKLRTAHLKRYGKLGDNTCFMSVEQTTMTPGPKLYTALLRALGGNDEAIRVLATESSPGVPRDRAHGSVNASALPVLEVKRSENNIRPFCPGCVVSKLLGFNHHEQLTIDLGSNALGINNDFAQRHRKGGSTASMAFQNQRLHLCYPV